MRLCRRKCHLGQLRARLCGPSAPGAPYEEVVRYQRRASDRHRLIVLVGTSLLTVALLLRSELVLLRFGGLALGVVAKVAFLSDSPINA